MSQPLRTLLEHRRRIEEQCQITLTREEQRLAQADGIVRLTELAHQAGLIELQDAQRAAVWHALAIQSGQMRVARLAAEVTRVRVVRDTIAARVASSRSACVAASQDRLALERHLENLEKAAAEVAQRAETERLGEIALARWRQHQPEAGDRR